MRRWGKHRRFRADGWKGGGTESVRPSHVGGTRADGRGRGEMQETSSRGVFLGPSPTYGLLPVYAGGSSGRQRNERTDVSAAIFPRTGANKVPAGGGKDECSSALLILFHPARYAIVRRVNTFVDRGNRRESLSFSPPPPRPILPLVEKPRHENYGEPQHGSVYV